MREVGAILLGAALMATAAGCGRANYTHGNRYEEGLVVCLSGAGGMMGETERVREGLNAGGVGRAIEIFEWSGGGVLADQTNVAANHRKAQRLSRRIEEYMRSYPGRPVHLVGVSAGTGLVVWALEDLSEGHQATGAVLISSSLDTKYDLTSALGKVSDRLYSFNSVADTVLSLGVTLTGTVDRGGGIAGGLVGFSPPNGVSDETQTLYKEKLVQISWWPGDVVLGHLGDHLGATSPSYVKEKIAPIVLGEKVPGLGAPKQPPTEAVKREEQKPATPDYAKRLEEKRKAEEAEKVAARKAAEEAVKKGEEEEKQAEEPPKPVKPKSKKPPTPNEAVRNDGKQRFFGWHVGRRAPTTEETHSSDAARFFREPRRLP